MAHQYPLAIRRLTQDDLPQAMAIQSACYPGFLVEGEAAFASRLHAGGRYCLAATHQGTLVAYLLAHPWQAGSPPPIGAVLAPDPAPNPGHEVLFIHDLAVASMARGSGIGRMMTGRAFERAAADGLRVAELIAVEGAEDYWRRLGFTAPAIASDPAVKLAGYGERARWMRREIP